MATKSWKYYQTFSNNNFFRKFNERLINLIDKKFFGRLNNFFKLISVMGDSLAFLLVFFIPRLRHLSATNSFLIFSFMTKTNSPLTFSKPLK